MMSKITIEKKALRKAAKALKFSAATLSDAADHFAHGAPNAEVYLHNAARTHSEALATFAAAKQAHEARTRRDQKPAPFDAYFAEAKQ